MTYQVIWQGIVHDTQGYARASREYLLALDKAGVDIKIEPLNFGTPSAELLPEQAKKIKELINKEHAHGKKKILVYHSQPTGIDPVAERAKGYDKVIINTVWETTIVPKEWFPMINQADAVMVPSTMNKESLINSGVTVPIFVIPHGADLSFNPDNEKLPLLGIEDTFNFLSVFQWQHRKGPDILFKAYLEEFSEEDKVSLIVKSYWGNNGLKQDQRMIKDTIVRYKEYLESTSKLDKPRAPIYYTGSLFSEEDMRGIYPIANAFVLPSRGEGVGLPYIEAMASGLPCIAPSWGGQADFINDGNGYLIDCNLEHTHSKAESAMAPNFFHLFTDEMKWAETDVNHLRKLMRHAYENQDEVKAKGKQARKDMENMSWDNSGVLIKNMCEDVLE